MSLVELCRFYDPEEALVAQSFLEVHGVPIFAGAYNHVSNAPHTRFIFGGMRLYICPQDLDVARQLLSDIKPIEHNCEACGQPYRPWRPRLLSACFALFFMVPFIHRKHPEKCSNCKAALPEKRKPYIPAWLTNVFLFLMLAPYAALYFG